MSLTHPKLNVRLATRHACLPFTAQHMHDRRYKSIRSEALLVTQCQCDRCTTDAFHIFIYARVYVGFWLYNVLQHNNNRLHGSANAPRIHHNSSHLPYTPENSEQRVCNAQIHPTYLYPPLLYKRKSFHLTEQRYSCNIVNGHNNLRWPVAGRPVTVTSGKCSISWYVA